MLSALANGLLTNITMLEDFNIKNWHLLIGDTEYFEDATDLDRDYVIRKAIKLLDRTDESTDQRHYTARLLLATHLSPQAAIDYSSDSDRARFQLIADYLRDEFDLDRDKVIELSKSIQRLLDYWDKNRKQVTRYRDKLLEQQDYECAHCHVSLVEQPTTEKREDDYKPYYLDPQYSSPEVDHITSVSTLGTNDISNLQVLCFLCNRGKGDGLGVQTRSEVKHAGHNLKDIGWRHRASMMYYTILRDERKCRNCDSNSSELTIRPDRPRGAYAQSNLLCYCVDCVYD